MKKEEKHKIAVYIEKNRDKGKIFATDIMIAFGISKDKIEKFLEEEYPNYYEPPHEGFLDFENY